MTKKTLAMVILDVFKTQTEPMTANDVYQQIACRRLWEFQSRDPVGIVRNALSRHGLENQHSCASQDTYFRQIATGDVALKEN